MKRYVLFYMLLVNLVVTFILKTFPESLKTGKIAAATGKMYILNIVSTSETSI